MSHVSVSSSTYTRTQTAVFVSDKMRTLLKWLVREYGLNPEKLLDAWEDWVDLAVRTWLISGDLNNITIEFYKPGSDSAVGRWDFPIRYDGCNDDDDLWVDRPFFKDTIAKTNPPSDCDYRIVLNAKAGRPDVPGVGSTTLRSTNHLKSREQGTVISTRDIMASARIYH